MNTDCYARNKDTGLIYSWLNIGILISNNYPEFCNIELNFNKVYFALCQKSINIKRIKFPMYFSLIYLKKLLYSSELRIYILILNTFIKKF